ncbi:DUF4179 domain-containing protein [Marinisporobacter balticus]|uniref:Uncharacterized protein DUF4179 n=1 Tax=Marinisporobacter balticus TaxID=2018667 RepID=A0A4V2SBV5_9FIRM|nr:DUF4179 domain-containing protein [Marinisporobacter balticus]TCO76890.1 uncharacterized protein DUF4179 [Marinisporobacter balticus]
MRNIENRFSEKKAEIENLQVPDELEMRLRSALKSRTSSSGGRSKWKGKLVALLIFGVLTGYHGDTLAFYSKKYIGYEKIMNSTLKKLNTLEKGQVIEKSYTFKNNVKLTLDGIMLDDNQLLVFYTVKDPTGNVDQVDISGTTMEGMVGQYHMGSGQGEMNDEKTEMKWIVAFESPYFFEKRLKWSFMLIKGKQSEHGEITFILDRNKAMGHTLKKVLNKKVKVDETEIRFESILATPTTTVIKGTIQNIVELAKDQILGERFRPETLDIKLFANGKEIVYQGGGMRTNINGMKFDEKFDALPKDLNKLEVHLISFGADHDVDEVIKLKNDGSNQNFKILGQNITINQVDASSGETYVTLTTEESVRLSLVNLEIDGKTIALEDTTKDTYQKKKDGRVHHMRTLRFKGDGKDLTLHIKRIKYDKIYNKIINISID